MTTSQTSLQRSAPNRTGPGPGPRAADREDLTAFLDWCQSRGLSRKTLATYREAGEQLAAYTAQKGMPLLASARREHVEDFLGELRRRGNKPATVRNRFASLRAFFSWMVRDDLRKDHPMARIQAPAVPDQVLPHYSEAQILAVLGVIPDKATNRHGLRDRALVLFLLDTGVRCQELCDLRICDLDRAARTVEIVSGKGGKGRVVAYSPDTANALNRYMRSRGGWDAQAATAPLFTARDGGPLATNGVRMTLQRRFADAGVEYRGSHGFRRSAGIGFLEQGGDPTDLKELMGWSSWSMLARYTKATARSRALRAHDAHSPVAAMLRKGKRP